MYIISPLFLGPAAEGGGGELAESHPLLLDEPLHLDGVQAAAGGDGQADAAALHRPGGALPLLRAHVEGRVQQAGGEAVAGRGALATVQVRRPHSPDTLF